MDRGPTVPPDEPILLVEGTAEIPLSRDNLVGSRDFPNCFPACLCRSGAWPCAWLCT